MIRLLCHVILTKHLHENLLSYANPPKHVHLIVGQALPLSNNQIKNLQAQINTLKKQIEIVTSK